MDSASKSYSSRGPLHDALSMSPQDRLIATTRSAASATPTAHEHHSTEMRVSSEGINIMGTLREEQEEKARLEKSNFDLKMKVYYLEESLKKMNEGVHMHDMQSEHARSEISTLKLQLEENQVDLEQRNLLLIKSKSAIEALKAEIERLRVEITQQQELEERVRRLKQLNEDTETDYKLQIAQLEGQLENTKQQLLIRETERNSKEEQLSKMEMTNQSTDTRLRDALIQRDGFEEKWIGAQQQIALLEDELTEGRAQMDLYRIQLQECIEDRDAVRDKLKETELMKVTNDSQLSSQIKELNAKHEAELKALRHEHDLEMERVRSSQLEMLNEVRDGYQQELSRVKAEMDHAMQQLKASEERDLDRTTESYRQRLEEKNEEIRAMRSMNNAESQRMDNILQELEATRVDLKQKTAQCENLRVEIVSKTEEIKKIPLLTQELEESKRENEELQAQIIAEQRDKAHIGTKLDQTRSALDIATEAVREKELNVQNSQSEINRLSVAAADLSHKTQEMERIVRENEKLKLSQVNLQSDLVGKTHENDDLRKELQSARRESQLKENEINSLHEIVKDTKTKEEASAAQVAVVEKQLQNERERRSAAEASCAEQRGLANSLREEIDRERQQKGHADRRIDEQEVYMQDLRQSVGRACLMCFEAMQRWDKILTVVLDGHAFDRIIRAAGGKVNRGKTGGFLSRAEASDDDDEDDYGGEWKDNRRQSRSKASRWETTQFELLSLPPDELLQKVAVRIERLGAKMDRARKIKSIFEAQGEQLVASLQNGLQNGHERISLYFHKITEAQSALNKLRHVVDRDMKLRDTESAETKHFKEVVLAQHSVQLKESEVRFAQQAQQMEADKQQIAAQKKEISMLQEQLSSAQNKNNNLQEELQQLARAENFLTELNDRANEMAEMNRSLAREGESKSETITRLTAENNDFLLERSHLISKVEILTSQLRTREDDVREYESKLDRMLREVERLRTRQINPELAQTIMDTQNILQHSTTLNLHSKHGSEVDTGSASAAQISQVVGEYVRSVQQIESLGNELINRTSDMVARFESHLYSGSGGPTVATRSQRISENALQTLKQEVFDLLDANARLAIQIQQLASDVKKGLRQLDPHRASSSPNSPNHLYRRNEDAKAVQSDVTTNASADSFFFPSRRGLISTPGGGGDDQRHPSNSIHLRDLQRSENKYDSGSNVKPYAPPLSSSRGSYSTAPYRSAGSGDIGVREAMNLSSTQRLTAHQSNSFNVPTPSASVAFTPTTRSGLPVGGSTSGSAATSRLNKLGSDLDALARRLDAYDTSKTK